MSQRFAFASSSITSHFNMAHTTNAVKKEDIAYTSASTAENQKESENVYAIAPTAPAPINNKVFFDNSSTFVIFKSLRPNKTIDQKRNRIVKALESTLVKLIQ